MLTSAFMMLVSSAFLIMRMGKNTGSFPKPLNAEDESRYLELWEKGDIEARNKLIEHNLRLVAHIVKKYYTQSSEIDDLISIGTIGLIKGISSYKKDKGVRLATYASRCIENAILPLGHKNENIQKGRRLVPDPLIFLASLYRI
ncbi:MAG: sigma-70 family RNA polymerase sigma factor [Clostridiales bacterium]|nr:sigma-70 family RNA polymerase sigma factor [Clostridiales bacterium]